MSKNSIWAQYEDRLRRVSAHIHAHLDDDLDLDSLSEIACLSAHHWHRIYRAVHGETLAQTVRRLRLHRASGEIVGTDLPVRQIAARWGYPDLASFTRVFAQTYGLPPARYRREGSHSLFQPEKVKETTDMYNISVRTIAPLSLLAVPHSGSYMGIGQAFEALYGTLHARGMFAPGMRMIGIYLDDPELVAEEKLRSFACVTRTGDAAVTAPPIVGQEIDGGDYAVLRHKGPYADMGMAYRWLYGTWLPQSDRALRNSPIFEEYLNTPRDVPPTELVTEIYMPLA